LTCSKDFTIKLFDLRKMETIYTLDHNTLSNYCDSGIPVSSDKNYFTVGTVKGEILVFDLLTGKVIY